MCRGHIQRADLGSKDRVYITGRRGKSNRGDCYCDQKNFGASGYELEAGARSQDYSHVLRLVTNGRNGMCDRLTALMCAYAHTGEAYAAKPDFPVFRELEQYCPAQ